MARLTNSSRRAGKSKFPVRVAGRIATEHLNPLIYMYFLMGIDSLTNPSRRNIMIFHIVISKTVTHSYII